MLSSPSRLKKPCSEPTGQITFQQARHGHEQSLHPMLGIPLAIKDVLALSGVRCTCGSHILENYVPPFTATSVDKLLDAGVIILGKTNTDEFAMGSSTENSAYGPTHNPWNLLAHTGRVQRRQRCCCLSQDGIRRIGYRYRRQRTPAGFLLRCYRIKNHLWTGLTLWVDRVRFITGFGGMPGQKCRRRRHDIRNHGRV